VSLIGGSAVGATGPGEGPAVALGSGPLEVEVHPHEGGRIAVLRYRGVDLVVPPGRVPGFWGDTFWPSPQSLFDWPPPAALDGEPYEVALASPGRLGVRSGVDPGLGLQVTKHYAGTPAAIEFSFTMTNRGADVRAVAPWQVTRAPRTGLVVWAPGAPFTDEDRLVKQREDPGCWYVHARGTQDFAGLSHQHGLAVIGVREVPRTCKLFADARGWLAHVHDGTILLRVFPDLAPGEAAARQAEVEVFFSPERDYIELENQGALHHLAPGASLSYATQWRMAALPTGVPTDRVTPGLVEALSALLGRSAA
jgi:hypothetical protein